MEYKQQDVKVFEGLAERFEKHLRATPNLPIYSFYSSSGCRSVTYQQLASRIAVATQELRQHVAAGDRALLIYEPGLDYITAFFACVFSGVIAVPLYPVARSKTKLATFLHVTADCDPSLVLTTSELQSGLLSIMSEYGINMTALATDNTTSHQCGFTLTHDTQAEDVAFLQYTSGSTGAPKGVMVTHGNLVTNQAQMQAASKHNTDDIGVSWLPPYHDMGLIGGIIQPLYVGFPVTLMAPAQFISSPLSWLQLISDTRATSTCAPNFSFDLCVRRVSTEQAKQLDLSSLQVVFNGAEPISADCIEKFADHFRESGFNKSAFLPCYGMAETTLMLTGRRDVEVLSVDASLLANGTVKTSGEKQSNVDLVSCGPPVNQVDIRIVDPETGRPSANGSVGEIWAQGPNITAGYWQQTEKTQETFNACLESEGHWFRSGDLGFLHEQELFVTGRLKNLIIVRGKNYYPHDIESLVCDEIESVNGAGVAAFSFTPAIEGKNTNDTSQEQLAIVCELTRKALRQQEFNAVCIEICKAIVQAFEIQPHTIALIKPATLPKTTSGKVRHFECKEKLLSGDLSPMSIWTNPALTIPDTNPLTPIATDQGLSALKLHLQKWMLDYVNHYSPEESITANSAFNETGLDSLASATFLGELSEQIKMPLDESCLVNYPTIEKLAKYVAAVMSVGQAMAELSSNEQTQLLTNLAESQLDQSTLALDDIPKSDYNFEESDAYLELQQRQNLINTTGVNPFFIPINGVNGNQIESAGNEYINFSSNNFLGLNNHPSVIDAAQNCIEHYGTSVSASRLISGEKPLHRELEQLIAERLNVDDALVFVGAATANVSTIGHLMNKHDLVLYDEYSHESVNQGIQLAHADSRPFKHNDYEHLESLLSRLRGRYKKVLIFIEGLYSMDGDTPDLHKFIDLKKKYKSWLMVDECLSIGVLGKTGRGIAEVQTVAPDDVDIWMGGLSKAFASCGGYIAGQQSLINHLKYTCPGFVFTTGMSPANAGAALAALKLIEQDPTPVTRLRQNTALFLQLAKEANFNVGHCEGHSIVPIILGDSSQCIALYKMMLSKGVNVQPILYPAVAENSARFRFSLTAAHSEDEIRYAVDCLSECYTILNSYSLGGAA